ncbi:MAG: hypothetical protein RL042_1009 [Nitrospirota bacterium]|jgi:hypothetical protein
MKDGSAQRKEHLQHNGRFFFLKPRLLKCTWLSQASSLKNTESARSELAGTIALATTFAQIMRAPISDGNWEH